MSCVAFPHMLFNPILNALRRFSWFKSKTSDNGLFVLSPLERDFSFGTYEAWLLRCVKFLNYRFAPRTSPYAP